MYGTVIPPHLCFNISQTKIKKLIFYWHLKLRYIKKEIIGNSAVMLASFLLVRWGVWCCHFVEIETLYWLDFLASRRAPPPGNKSLAEAT